MGEVQTFELGETRLQRGMTLPNAKLVYSTYGTLAPDRSNLILYPTSYGAQHGDLEWLIGPGRVLDPERWFIVIPNKFGNGQSSSQQSWPFENGRAPSSPIGTMCMHSGGWWWRSSGSKGSR